MVYRPSSVNEAYSGTLDHITMFTRTTNHLHVLPTQGNSYDCCDRFYGAPEYPMLIEPDQSSYRVVDKYLFADTTEILANTVIVDKEVNDCRSCGMGPISTRSIVSSVHCFEGAKRRASKRETNTDTDIESGR